MNLTSCSSRRSILFCLQNVLFLLVPAPPARWAKYGARFFSNVGKFSNHIDDPYFPVTNDMARNALAIVLSVSGETEEILRFASQFSLHRCKVMSITSHEHSRLAKLADFNLPGTFRKRASAASVDITTQIPVIYILETLGRKLARNLTRKCRAWLLQQEHGGFGTQQGMVWCMAGGARVLGSGRR